MRRLPPAFLGMLAAVTLALASDEPPISQIEAQPQRPTRSRNARTTPAGTVQLETGVGVDRHDLTTDLTFRFGVTRNLDVSVEAVPYLRLDFDGEARSGLGDTVVDTKFRFFDSREGSSAVEVFVKIPTADKDKALGTGDTDAGFRFIASRNWRKDKFDFNLGGEFAGVPEVASNEAQWTLVLTWWRSVGDRLSFFGEGFLQFLPAADREDVTTDWGISYRFNPSFALDAAVYLGLTDDAPDYEVTVGITKILGRTFTPRSTRGSR